MVAVPLNMLEEGMPIVALLMVLTFAIDQGSQSEHGSHELGSTIVKLGKSIDVGAGAKGGTRVKPKVTF
jgi:hypothetical protein